MFYAAVPFGAKNKGEQWRGLSKICPHGDAQEFCVVSVFFSSPQNCCATLTDKAALPTSESRKVRHKSGYGKSMGFIPVICKTLWVKLRFYMGKVRCKRMADVV